MKLNIIVISVLLTNCQDHPKQIEISTKEIKENIQRYYDNHNFEDIMLLEMMDAIKKHGNPLKQEISKLKNMQGEFWEGLEEKFTQDERQDEIVIHELTWEKDSLNFITVWYHETIDKRIPKDFYIWNKEIEF